MTTHRFPRPNAAENTPIEGTMWTPPEQGAEASPGRARLPRERGAVARQPLRERAREAIQVERLRNAGRSALAPAARHPLLTAGIAFGLGFFAAEALRRAR